MFKKKKKLTLFFKSGNKIELTCDEYKFTWDRSTCEFVGYDIINMSPHVNFVPSQLEMYSVEN